MVVSRHDEGGYRCTADNGFGIKIRDVFITAQCEYDYLFHDAWRFGMDYGLSQHWAVKAVKPIKWNIFSDGHLFSDKKEVDI